MSFVDNLHHVTAVFFVFQFFKDFLNTRKTHQTLTILILNLGEGNGNPLQYTWKIPWTEEPGRLQSMGSWWSDTTERLHFHVSLSCIREGNGNPFQCSCLENPRDGRAWWAVIYGVAQSRTRLKRLSSSILNLPCVLFIMFTLLMH